MAESEQTLVDDLESRVRPHLFYHRRLRRMRQTRVAESDRVIGELAHRRDLALALDERKCDALVGSDRRIVRVLVYSQASSSDA